MGKLTKNSSGHVRTPRKAGNRGARFVAAPPAEVQTLSEMIAFIKECINRKGMADLKTMGDMLI